MMLSPSSPNEPFKPFAVFHDRRSVIPDDRPDTDITFFEEIVDAVDEKAEGTAQRPALSEKQAPQRI
jgi:hypothetical protein